MRRLLVAAFISLLWSAIFALSLFAQSGPDPARAIAPSTIPPFEPPPGAVITVTTTVDNLSDNGDCTLREAIQAANTDAAVDVCPPGRGTDLILLPAGHYGLSLAGRSEDANATGDLDIGSDLVISGAGSGTTIIDAQGIDRVLHVLTGTVEIRGVTIQNGRAADGANSGCGDNGEYGCPGEPGGGMVNRGSTRLVDVVVQDSRSGDGSENENNIMGGEDGGDGGGIVNEGRLELFSTQVTGNRSGDGAYLGSSSGGDGGGIYNLGILIGDGVIVSANQMGRSGWTPHVSSIFPGLGGGITNRGTMTITNGQIFSNTAVYDRYSGGVYNFGDAWFSNSDISYNTGGGIINGGSVFLNGSTISNNRDGGGLRNGGTASLVNCTISGNRAGKGYAYYSLWPPIHFFINGGDGGGVANYGNLLLQNTTIAYNQTGEGACYDGKCNSAGGSGGGLANEGGAVTIHNSLIAQNTVADGGAGPDCTGIVSSQGPNFIGSDAGCTLAEANDDILDRYAFLGPLMDNGGPTPTHALLPYSRALDAGSCTDISGAPLLTDQRGVSRPQGAGCDLGAYESGLSTVPLPETRYLPVIQR